MIVFLFLLALLASNWQHSRPVEVTSVPICFPFSVNANKPSLDHSHVPSGSCISNTHLSAFPLHSFAHPSLQALHWFYPVLSFLLELTAQTYCQHYSSKAHLSWAQEDHKLRGCKQKLERYKCNRLYSMENRVLNGCKIGVCTKNIHACCPCQSLVRRALYSIYLTMWPNHCFHNTTVNFKGTEI